MVSSAAAEEQNGGDVSGSGSESSSSSTEEHPCTKSLTCADIQLLSMLNFPPRDYNKMICISYYAATWCPFAVSENKTAHGLWEIDESHLGQEVISKVIFYILSCVYSLFFQLFHLNDQRNNLSSN